MAHGVLAHVVATGDLSPEPAATRALGYILSCSSEVTQQFISTLLESTGTPTFAPGKIVAERWVAAGTIPDLTIEDTEGRRRMLFENKFWANLTKNQPVSYLNALSTDTPSVLLFIVPKPRMSYLWRELKDRCKKSTIGSVQEEERSANTFSGAVTVDGARHALQITNWMYVLRTLDRLANDAGSASLRQDIHQLQGLASFQDDSRIELEYSIETYLKLTREIVAAMQEAPRVRTKGLTWGGNSNWKGRYVKVDDFGIGIGASRKRGQERGLTPLCCTLWNTKWGGLLGHDWEEATHEFAKHDGFVDAIALYVPLEVDTNFGRVGIVNDVVRQVLEIADKLHEIVGTRT